MSSLVPPFSISILSSNTSLVENGSLTVTEDKVETVSCMTRHSNPPPTISWILGNTILQATNQTNTMEEDTNKWTSKATLEHVFLKSNLGSSLTCVVEHEAYPTGEETMTAILDILCRCSTYLQCWY